MAALFAPLEVEVALRILTTYKFTRLDFELNRPHARANLTDQRRRNTISVSFELAEVELTPVDFCRTAS